MQTVNCHREEVFTAFFAVETDEAIYPFAKVEIAATKLHRRRQRIWRHLATTVFSFLLNVWE